MNKSLYLHKGLYLFFSLNVLISLEEEVLEILEEFSKLSFNFALTFPSFEALLFLFFIELLIEPIISLHNIFMELYKVNILKIF